MRLKIALLLEMRVLSWLTFFFMAVQVFLFVKVMLFHTYMLHVFSENFIIFSDVLILLILS